MSTSRELERAAKDYAMAVQRFHDTCYAYDRLLDDGGALDFKTITAYQKFRKAQTELSDALDRLAAAARDFSLTSSLKP